MQPGVRGSGTMGKELREKEKLGLIYKSCDGSKDLKIFENTAKPTLVSNN